MKEYVLDFGRLDIVIKNEQGYTVPYLLTLFGQSTKSLEKLKLLDEKPTLTELEGFL